MKFMQVKIIIDFVEAPYEIGKFCDYRDFDEGDYCISKQILISNYNRNMKLLSLLRFLLFNLRT